MDLPCVSPLGYDVTFAVLYSGGQCDCSAFVYAFDLGPYIHCRVVLSDIRGGDVCAPNRYVYSRQGHMAYFPVQSGSGIPARRLRPVLKEDCDFVRAWLKCGSDVAVERIVAVRPEADLLSVNIYLRLAHRSVEQKYMPAAVEVLRPYVEAAAISAFAHIRKSSGASGLFGCHVFTVLHHGNCLKVIGFVERAVYCPVVRYADLFPSFGSLHVVIATELPFLQDGFCPLPLRKCCG